MVLINQLYVEYTSDGTWSGWLKFQQALLDGNMEHRYILVEVVFHLWCINVPVR